MVAEYGGLPSTDEGGIKYVLQDWQGSTRAIVSNTGFVNARMDYQAFGEEIQTGIGQRTTTQGFDASNNLQDKYALTKRDEATGLDHTWFRKNENRAGRWTSPDPYNGSMSLGNPQSFNRYSYVNNQPTNFIDPSGLFTVCRTYSEGWVDPVTHVVNVHERTECTSYFENGGGGTIYDPGRNGGGIGDPGNHGGGVRIERDGGSTPSEPKTKKDDEYKDYNECERAEKRKCYEKGANSFYDNAPTYMFFGALGFAGGMNTIYSIIKGVSLWGVTRIAGVIGLTVGAVLGLRRAALEGDRLDKECRADIPKKCEKYKK
jgi:RHS repeat-associated protein